MGRTLDLLIALGTMAVALFGLGSGTFIYIQYSGAVIGLLIFGMSVLGGVLGAAKFARMRGSTTSRHTRQPIGSAGRRY